MSTSCTSSSRHHFISSFLQFKNLPASAGVSDEHTLRISGARIAALTHVPPAIEPSRAARLRALAQRVIADGPTRGDDDARAQPGAECKIEPEAPSAAPQQARGEPKKEPAPSAAILFLHGSGDTGAGIRRWLDVVWRGRLPRLCAERGIRLLTPSATPRPAR